MRYYGMEKNEATKNQNKDEKNLAKWCDGTKKKTYSICMQW